MPSSEKRYTNHRVPLVPRTIPLIFPSKCVKSYINYWIVVVSSSWKPKRPKLLSKEKVSLWTFEIFSNFPPVIPGILILIPPWRDKWNFTMKEIGNPISQASIFSAK